MYGSWLAPASSRPQAIGRHLARPSPPCPGADPGTTASCPSDRCWAFGTALKTRDPADTVDVAREGFGRSAVGGGDSGLGAGGEGRGLAGGGGVAGHRPEAHLVGAGGLIGPHPPVVG